VKEANLAVGGLDPKKPLLGAVPLASVDLMLAGVVIYPDAASISATVFL
jgi:hypothetical protein